MGKEGPLLATAQYASTVNLPAPRSRLSKLITSTVILVTFALFYSTGFLFPLFHTTTSTPENPWEGLAAHCEDAQPIDTSEFLERQRQLAQTLYDLKATAYVAEPSASAFFFANVSVAAWFLTERPLLTIISPLEKDGEVSARVTILTPTFEEARAKLLDIPGINVEYVAWQEDEDPYVVTINALRTTAKGPIYVDGMTRHFIVDGLQKATPGLSVLSAPPEITSLRERKSQSEIALLKCTNEVALLAIRAVQEKMYIGIRESQVLEMIDDALATAGLTERWALVLFGDNAAYPHGSGSDRVLGVSDLILIDAGGSLLGYNSDVTRTFQLKESRIPEEHHRLWWVVREAQTIALRTAKAGVITAEVDKAARTYLTELGFGAYFTHRLGHGIGVESHEAPYLRGGTSDIIQTGNAFSDEPGVYIEGKVGIRLEDCFYISEEGEAIYLTEGVGGQAVDLLHP